MKNLKLHETKTVSAYKIPYTQLAARFPIHNFLFHPEDVFHIANGEFDTFVLFGGEKNAVILPHWFAMQLI